MLKLIKNGYVYAPEDLGPKDVLVAAGKIIAIGERLDLPGGVCDTETIDAEGKLVVPGFIDSHVHILGGGGEGGYHTRTPEIQLTDIASGGVTTVVGVIGTDGTSRTMASLVVKARALRNEGITCYAHTGNYHVPVKTLTGRIEDDLLLIDLIIGVGEVAISDHRSSQPTTDDLARLASAARIGGMLAGKAGIVNVHVGDGADRLDPLLHVTRRTEVPITQFLPTHINRNAELFGAGVDYAREGGYVDFTTSTTEKFLQEGEVKCSRALKTMLDEGVPLDRITMTSDAQGSLPEFDADGDFVGLQVGKVGSLYKEVRDVVRDGGVPLEDALQVITSNPARILKLPHKGNLKTGGDADLVLLDQQSLEIYEVIAMGHRMVSEGRNIRAGAFE